MTDAIFHTPRGDIAVTLFDATAPKTVANFVNLARKDFYTNLSFHRVEPNFVIQGGCPNSKEGARGVPGTGGPGYTIPCETGPGNPEKHTPGTLSMAHAGKNTGGSQFFITHTATPHLDGKHTVFGRVKSPKDLEVVLAIRRGDRFSVEIVGPAATSTATPAPAT
jgi:peptidyl-prolyl cis-trans isomerase B (cyclophilin B)